MKKLDFRNFSVPTGITRQTREVFDAREQIADLLYTRVSGIKAHRLAFKIFESTGETEFSDEETDDTHGGGTLLSSQCDRCPERNPGRVRNR